MTAAQKRLVEAIRDAGEWAEYWPIMNDWVKDRGPEKSLALRNINATVNALIKANVITLDDDGCFHLTEAK